MSQLVSAMHSKAKTNAKANNFNRLSLLMCGGTGTYTCNYFVELIANNDPCTRTGRQLGNCCQLTKLHMSTITLQKLQECQKQPSNANQSIEWPSQNISYSDSLQDLACRNSPRRALMFHLLARQQNSYLDTPASIRIVANFTDPTVQRSRENSTSNAKRFWIKPSSSTNTKLLSLNRNDQHNFTKLERETTWDRK